MSLNSDLEEFQSRSNRLIDESPQMDEQNTKRKIIEPLIEILGWEILTNEVELEYSVKMGAGTKKVDYALLSEGSPVVFIEAKGLDTKIVDTHIDQLTSYMRQVGVDWGLISNGQTYQIFRRDRSSTRPNEVSLANFGIDDITENQHPLRALSKEAIERGESERIAEKIQSIQSAMNDLQEKKEDLAEEISEVISVQIGESVSQVVEDEAKIFIDNLIATLDTRAHRFESERSSKESPTTSDSEYSIVLKKDGTIVQRFSDETQVQAMADVVNFLIGNYQLLDIIDIPYVPGTGRGTRALINDAPVHTNGAEMRQYKELANGYYLFTSLSAEDKFRYLSELPELVDLEVEFSDNW